MTGDDNKEKRVWGLVVHGREGEDEVVMPLTLEEERKSRPAATLACGSEVVAVEAAMFGADGILGWLELLKFFKRKKIAQVHESEQDEINRHGRLPQAEPNDTKGCVCLSSIGRRNFQKKHLPSETGCTHAAKKITAHICTK